MNLIKESNAKVAVFSLKGDPFTIVHRDICKQAMDKLPIDKLYVIPTIGECHHTGKEKWLNAGERFECAKRMLWSLGPDYMGKWEIDRHELDLKYMCIWADQDKHFNLNEEIIEKRKFIHTLLDFKSRIGKFKQIMLLLGKEDLEWLPHWDMWKEVCWNVSALVQVVASGCESSSIPNVVRKEIGGRFCTLPLSSEELSRVSTRKVRQFCIKNCLNLDLYIECVSDLDNSRVKLAELGWTA